MDAAVGVAGYNSFHEQLLGGIPTLFIPNEAAEMDSQLTRGHWAQVMGMGLLVRSLNAAAELDGALGRLLDDGARAKMCARMATLPTADGAKELAGLVSDYTAMIRTDRFPNEAYPR